MLFDKQYIDEVIEKNDIVDVISMYTNLKKNGNNYTGLCPFHSEKTPSFSVSSEKQMYHCFGCGVGGTIIHFIKDIENYDFTETIKYLAQRANIPLPDEKSFTDEEYVTKKHIYEMNKEAARHFYKNLISSDGEKALNYLMGRNIKKETIVSFGLGYSKNSWDDIYKLLKSKGYNKKEILKSGLCVEKNGKVFDFFRNRVMFPVMDIRGNVIAFGGRNMGDEKPKYLNSLETPVFSKKNILFNMNKAKDSGKDYFLLMEGYMDVVSVYQAGFKNAVASLGTALTQEHSRLIKRYTSKAILSYDSDEAGKQATKKATSILKKDGINFRILKIKGAKDPDELIKKFGSKAYESCIENALSGVEYELENLMPNEGFLSDEDKIEFVKKGVNLLSDIYDPIEVEVYAKKLSKITKISYENIISQVNYRKKYKNKEKKEKFEKNYVVRKKSPEEMMIKIIVENPSYFGKIKDKIEKDDFSDEINKKIFDNFKKMWESGIKPQVSDILDTLNGDEVKKAGEIFIEKESFSDFLGFFDELLKKMKEKKFNFDENKSEKEELEKLLEYTKKLKEKKGTNV